MGFKLKLLEARPSGRAPAVGEVWPEKSYVEGPDKSLYSSRLSQGYRSTAAGKRAPLVVRLPDGGDYVLDFQPGLKVTTDEAGMPSVEGLVDVPGRWKGYIQNGELLSSKEFEATKKDAPAEAPAATRRG